MIKECKKHKMKPRYDETYSTVIIDLMGITAKNGGRISSESMPWQQTPYLKEKKYVHDVCVKCGFTVKR